MTFDDFCRQNNIVVQYSNFTTKLKGMCLKVDDYYIVMINARYDSETNKKTVIHEIIHIMENHFQCDCSQVEECENEVKRIIKDIKFHFEMAEEFYIDFSTI